MRYTGFRSILFLGVFLAPFLCSAVSDVTFLGGVAFGDEPDAAATQLFVTSSGERMVGTLQNPDQNPRTEYRIRTLEGKTVRLSVGDLKSSRRARQNEVEYARRKAAAADTVEAQWELAEWCREHHFLSGRKTHLNRVIQLEPDHRDARAAMGYRLFNGKWMTQEEIQESRGYRRYRGRWLTEQQIESIQRAERREKEAKQWYAKIKRYLGWLDSSRTALAMQNFSKITDPAAVDGLGSFLESESSRPVKLLLIHTLVHIDGANPDDRSACLPLALCALEDPDEEVRLSCLDHLKTTKDRDVVDFFIGKLNVTPATRKYKKDANLMINRAAMALGEMGDDAAVGPLIKVLITEHKEKIVSGKPGQTAATFGNRGGGGMSAGSSVKVVTHQIENTEVLEALKKLTGVSFNYDIVAWQAWCDRKTQTATPDTRRGNTE